MKRLIAAVSYIVTVTAVALIGACATEEPEPPRHVVRPAVRAAAGSDAGLQAESPVGRSAAQRFGLGDPVEDTDSGGSDLIGPPEAIPSPEPLAQPSAVDAQPTPESRLGLVHEPDPGVDHLLDGETALTAGDSEGALEAFRKAAHDQESYESFMGVARAARALRDRELALAALEAAAGADETAAEPLIQAARMCIGTGEVDRGLRLVARAIRREPDRPDAFNVRGRLWMAKEQYEKAVLAFQAAVELDAWHVWSHNNMGYVFLLTGRYEEAVASLEKATSLTPVKAYMWNNLGLAYEKVGRSTDARRAYGHAVSMNPEYVNARINLERVRRVAMVAPAPESAGLAPESAGLAPESAGLAPEEALTPEPYLP